MDGVMHEAARWRGWRFLTQSRIVKVEHEGDWSDIYATLTEVLQGGSLAACW